ncbi:MAG: hypothetical protein E7331_00890 [Clostridiales bacterium]|nr:hypothetical protein [Clostridiales bacterium]
MRFFLDVFLYSGVFSFGSAQSRQGKAHRLHPDKIAAPFGKPKTKMQPQRKDHHPIYRYCKQVRIDAVPLPGFDIFITDILFTVFSFLRYAFFLIMGYDYY